MPKIGWPLTILGLSKPRTDWPMILKALGSFSVTVLRSGAGIEAAFSASWAYVSPRPVGVWVTVLIAAVHSVGDTFQVAAAASIITCRPAAPTRRRGS